VTARRKNVNRLLDPRWGNVDGGLRLWDREGRLWTLARDDVDHESAARLYRDPTVPVAVAEGAGGLDWVDPAERRRRWTEELEPRTFDADWRPPRDAPGSLPFEALEFRSGDDRLLLFVDDD
jgi:hypothetical protein